MKMTGRKLKVTMLLALIVSFLGGAVLSAMGDAPILRAVLHLLIIGAVGSFCVATMLWYANEEIFDDYDPKTINFVIAFVIGFAIVPLITLFWYNSIAYICLPLMLLSVITLHARIVWYNATKLKNPAFAGALGGVVYLLIYMTSHLNMKLALFAMAATAVSIILAAKMNDVGRKCWWYIAAAVYTVVTSALPIYNMMTSYAQTRRIAEYILPQKTELFNHVKAVLSDCSWFSFNKLSEASLDMELLATNPYIGLIEVFGIVAMVIILLLQVAGIAAMFIHTKSFTNKLYKYFALISTFVLGLQLLLGVMSSFFVIAPIGVGAPLLTTGGLTYSIPPIALYILMMRFEQTEVDYASMESVEEIAHELDVEVLDEEEAPAEVTE